MDAQVFGRHHPNITTKKLDRGHYPEADLYPVLDRRCIPISKPTAPAQKIRLEIPDFSFDKAAPKFAAAIDAEIDCNDTDDDLIKKKLHSNIRSSSTDLMSGAEGG